MFLPNSGLENHPDGSGDLNPVVNSNWRVFNNWIAGSLTLTASQTAFTVTASANIFVVDDIGATIRFADETTAVITAFTNATTVTVGVSQTVGSQAFDLYRLDQNEYTAIPRGMLKRVRMIAGDDTKVPAWSNSLNRFTLVPRPGYGTTAGQIFFGGGAAADMASSADFTWDDSTKLFVVNGNAQIKKALFVDKQSVTANTATTTPDFALGNTFDCTVSTDTTIAAPSNVKVGGIYYLILRQDGTGGRKITFNAVFKFPLGFVPISTIAANAITMVVCVATATNELICVDAGTSPQMLKQLLAEQATISYSGTTNIDLDKAAVQKISLTGNLTLTTSNRKTGASVDIILACDATPRNLTFPAWKFMNSAAPASIAASKTAYLSVYFSGTNDSDGIAWYSVEP